MTNDDAPDRAADEALLAAVCREAQGLLGRVSGAVTRLEVRAGDHRVEIEWDPAAAPAPAGGAAAPAAVTSGPVEVDSDLDRVTITAPLVGTFYRAAEPGAKPFVEEGDIIEAGQVVGIVEAMKLFNRIESDVAGRVAKILVEDREMVEFGQDLIVLEPVDGSGEDAGDTENG